MKQRIKLLSELFRTAFGLFVFAFGTYLTICGNIGLAPWDALSMGVSYHTPLSYGVVHTIISIVLLVLDLLMKEKIGYGSVLDALLVGNFVDLFARLNLLQTQESVAAGIFFILVGMLVMAWGQFFYMSVGHGCGPRDSFLVGIGRRFPKVPIGFVNVGILCVVLAVSLFLGAPIGLGTVIAAVGEGSAMQIVFRLLRFEPRHVRHRSLWETTQRICQGNDWKEQVENYE